MMYYILSPVYVIISSVCFSMTILVGWEFIKYGGYIDIGLNDTMIDLLSGLYGAIMFSLFEYKYLKSRNENSFIKRFISTFEKNVI